jgi:hypothetical protein
VSRYLAGLTSRVVEDSIKLLQYLTLESIYWST